MIRGINGHPYLNLDSYIDIETFKSLHYKICRGIVLSKYKKEGNIVKMGGWNNQYDPEFKPICFALDDYEALPDDHEIKQIGRELGELDNRDEFVLFLKLALGAYDPYQFVFLKTEEGGWASRFEEKSWTPDASYFPELRAWLEQLVPTVFTHLGRIIIFKAEHDCIMPLHRDLIYPTETDYVDHRHEFLHLRTTLDKPFYIWDTGLEHKVLVDSHATFFNDQDWHAGGRTNQQTYSIRVDGVFADEFRQRIGLGSINHY